MLGFSIFGLPTESVSYIYQRIHLFGSFHKLYRGDRFLFLNLGLFRTGNSAASLLRYASVLEKPTFSRGLHNKSEASSTLSSS